MSLLDKLTDALVPQTAKGVEYRCANCDETFDDARAECPNCGSTDVKEEEGFELRPQS